MIEADTDDAPESAQSPHPAHTPLNQRNYQGLVEQRLAQAIAQGAMNNLPGAGKPLNLDDDANVPAEDRAGFRLLKANGFAPPWIEARKDIATEQAALERWRAQMSERWSRLREPERVRVRAEYHDKLRQLQRTIASHNLLLPPGVEQLPGLRFDEELRKLG